VHRDEASIFCPTWVDALPKLPTRRRCSRNGRRILAVRGAVQKELRRCARRGRSALRCRRTVTITASGDDYDALVSLGDDLRFVLITSAAAVVKGEGPVITRRPARTRNASAAGITARTSGSTPGTRRSAALRRKTCSEPASRARARELRPPAQSVERNRRRAALTANAIASVHWPRWLW